MTPCAPARHQPLRRGCGVSSTLCFRGRGARVDFSCANPPPATINQIVNRISFDLDGTLLCKENAPHSDRDLPPLVSHSRTEFLRRGVAPILRAWASEGVQLWIYTESLRGRSPVLAWFAALQIPIAGMVNRQLHEAEWQRRGAPNPCPRKFPPWFGISVHVDNDPEIQREGLALGYRVILVSQDAPDFARQLRPALST